MDLIDRIIFFSIGGAVGFVFGYIVAHLRVIERKVDYVEQEIHERKQDEEGSLKQSTMLSIMMALVLVLTVFASFSASKTNGELDQTVYCLTEYNTNQGKALNSRDEAIKIAADAEIKLWAIYDRLYNIAQSEPKKIPILQERLNEAISKYREKLIVTQKARDIYEYDDPDVLKDCEKRDQSE